VHLHPYYRNRFGTGPGLCPRAEAAYERILTLPLFARMTDAQVGTVIETTLEVIASFAA
jgi:perosamine synthetase